mgnify:CR=1 FL=1
MPKSSSPVARRVRKFVADRFLRAFGWEVEGGLPATKKAVVVAAPHTSAWDFPFTLAVAWSLGFEMNFVAKRELFRFPFGGIMRALGGISVDRARTKGFVGAVAKSIREREEVYVIIAPEATRAKAPRWRTGFYHMALEAECPVVLGYLDFARKRGGLGHVFQPTGDIELDFPQITAFYEGILGKHPSRMSETRLVVTDEERAIVAKSHAERLARKAAANAEEPYDVRVVAG